MLLLYMGSLQCPPEASSSLFPCPCCRMARMRDNCSTGWKEAPVWQQQSWSPYPQTSSGWNRMLVHQIPRQVNASRSPARLQWTSYAPILTSKAGRQWLPFSLELGHCTCLAQLRLGAGGGRMDVRGVCLTSSGTQAGMQGTMFTLLVLHHMWRTVHFSPQVFQRKLFLPETEVALMIG